MHLWALALTAFMASAVEAIEAATIVLAVGYAQNWRVALAGAVCASIALAAIVGIGGPAILYFIPIKFIRIAIGAFLLWFGYGWLRKAVLRYAHRIPMRDEKAVFEHQVGSLRVTDGARVGFITAFNGVFLEGIEVVIIVVSVGSASKNALLAAAAGAAAAGFVVAITAALARRPFARIPENTMKFIVGIMLVSFGTFWLGEGLGIPWPLGDATLLVLAAAYAALAFLATRILARPTASTAKG